MKKPDETTPKPETKPAAEGEIHPVLADILQEKEPDTVSWVKG